MKWRVPGHRGRLLVLLLLPVYPGWGAAEAASAGNAMRAGGTAELTVSIEDASSREGGTVEFRVVLSEERAVPLQVPWELTPGTAVAGVDYRPVEGGTLRIPAGATEGSIRIRTLEDRVREPDDVFTVSLLDVLPIPPDGALLSEDAHTATGTILDDDGGFEIPDENLEHAIWAELGKAGGESLTAEDLASLTRLNIDGNGIADLNGIAFATNLTQFWMSRSEVTDLSPLGHLPSLTSLRLGRGSIRNLSPLSGLTDLQELSLNDNSISDLEPLRRLARLERLYLGGNDIVDVEPLQDLANLDTLGLQRNLVADLAPLGRLFALRLLDLEANAVSNLGPLRNLNRLRSLELADNSISDLAPLAALDRLVFLDLGRNAVTDLAPLLGAADVSHGGRVYLHDNPLDEESLAVHVPALREGGADVHTVSVSVGDASAPEGEPLNFRVFLSAPVTEPVDLVWRVERRRYSTHGVDYVAPRDEFSELTIPAGDTEAMLTVQTSLDHEDEPHEPLLVNLWAPPWVSRWADHPGFPTGVTMSHPENPIEGVGLILEPGSPMRDIPFVGSADHEMRQGVVRIVNRHRGVPTAVHIEAFDDLGDAPEPVTLSIRSGEARQFVSRDLERGNAIKGLSAGVGAGRGDWRLRVQSNDIEAYAYVRTGDGLLTGMHDLIPLTSVGYFVPIFNPGRNPNQVSWLRLTNTGERTARVRITGVDDAGNSPGSQVNLNVAPGRSRLISSSDLESGAGSGVDGALGRGTGKWRLFVASNVRIGVMNLLESPTGHLSNLSTLAAELESEDGAGDAWLVPLFPSAMDAKEREGFVRVINRGDETAEVLITARDDSRWTYDPVTLTVAAGAAAQLNSHDLESGNRDKGLPLGVGAGDGDWRLELTSAQDIDVGGYVRTRDGFLTSMHDRVPGGAEGYYVPIFNPARNVRQASFLRFVNRSPRSAAVRVQAVDDRGRSPGEEVLLYVGRESARNLSSGVLEEGLRGLDGKIGRGYGKWRLSVTSSRPIEVMNLMETPTGHLVNLSTQPLEMRR